MARTVSVHRGMPRPVAHRADTSMWLIDRAWLRLDDVRRTTAAWLAQPVRATRRAHALVATSYASVAVGAGLLVTLIGAHR